MKGKAVVLMGSERDLEFCREIAKHLKALSVEYEFRAASAHKTPMKVLEVLKEFESEKVVYITVAGTVQRSKRFCGRQYFKACHSLPTLL